MNEKKVKQIIRILCVLLATTTLCLGARVVYLKYTNQHKTVVIPENIISEENPSVNSHQNYVENKKEEQYLVNNQQSPRQAVSIELYQHHSTDNQAFKVENMFPGDIVTQYYSVRVKHDEAIDLYFKTIITEETKQLGEILQIKVTELNQQEVLYEGPIDLMQAEGYIHRLPKNEEETSTSYYQIEVSLPTSASNEYQNALLKSDFQWYVKDETSLQTGDYQQIKTYASLLGITSLILLLEIKRRKKEEQA